MDKGTCTPRKQGITRTVHEMTGREGQNIITMRKIIDTHCHIYPDAIATKAMKAIDRFYDGLPSDLNGGSLDHYDGTVATLVKSGTEAGISHFVVHSVATTPHQVSSINRFIAKSVKDSGGRFTGLGTMHLESDNYKRDIDELVSLGLKGIKLHPDIQKFCVDDPRAMRIFGMCAKRGLPVCVHTGDHRYDYSNPDRVIRVLKAFPSLKLVGAHFGGWSIWKEAGQILHAYPNIIVDTSSSLYALKPDEVKELIRLYGIERVMFGTDYPLWQQKPEIDYLLGLGLTEEEYDRIFWKNAAELYGIEMPDEQE